MSETLPGALFVRSVSSNCVVLAERAKFEIWRLHTIAKYPRFQCDETSVQIGGVRSFGENRAGERFLQRCRDGQSIGPVAEPRHCWETSLSSNGGEKSGSRGAGGGRGTGIQRSLNLVCPKLHMRVRLRSNCFAEIKREIGSANFRISPAWRPDSSQKPPQ
jgi:hypothetical protein